MSIFDVSIPVPSTGPATGAAIDVSSMGGEKTFVIEGTGDGQIVLEGSHVGSAFFPFAIYDILTDPSPKKISIVLAAVRARRLNGSGVVSITVSGEAGVANAFLSLAVPAGNGAGASSSLGSAGMLRTAAVIGPYSGIIGIEASADGGVTFDPVATFNTQASDFQTFSGAYNAVRVRRYDTQNDPAPIVTIGIEKSEGGSAAACGCDCIDEIYKLDDNFDSSLENNPKWIGLGLTAAIANMGGTWRASVTADPGGASMSFFMTRERTLALAGNAGNVPSPPLSTKWKVYVDLGSIVDGTFAAIGIADIVHDPNTFIAFFAFNTSGPISGTWVMGINDGTGIVLVPTTVPVHTTCETAQLLEMKQKSDGNVDLFIDGIQVGSFVTTPALRAHLFSPITFMQRQNPAAAGAVTALYFCGSEGYVCLDNPGEIPFGNGGDWIQSTSNRTGGDFTTTSLVYTLIQTVSLVAKGGTSLIVWGAVASENDNSNTINSFRFTLDGVPIPGAEFSTWMNGGVPHATAMLTVKIGDPPFTAGLHTIALEWKVSGGTGKILSGVANSGEFAVMVAAEVAV